jgi:lipopolysaccharide export system permease protein
MRIIRRYITVHLVWMTFIALAVLMALFSFFSLINELGKTGVGSYGIPQALLYVLLTMPRTAYELFPIAAVVGSMAVLGIMAQNSELDVIRTSGVSRFDLAVVMVRSGLVLVLIAVVFGEFVAPASEERAQHLRSMALTNQITTNTRYGVWARHGDSFINIRKALPGNRVEDVYVYEFDGHNRLRSSVFAKSAEYRDGHWLMHDIRESVIDDQKVVRRDIKEASWGSLLDPDMINLIMVKPQFLAIWELAGYIRYLRHNAQNTQLYEQALWTKLIRPFSILAMIVLAVPLVRGHSRFGSVSQRVFLGAFAGIIFHLCNQVSDHLGVVYGISPLVSVLTPTLILILILAYLLRE